MKKRKLFLLFPMMGMILSGCSFQDGLNWVSDNIFAPIGEFFSGLFGKQLDKDSVVAAIKKTLDTDNFTADMKYTDDLIVNMQIDGNKQLQKIQMTYGGATHISYNYAEVVDDVTYTYVSQEKDGPFNYSSSEQGNKISLKGGEEDIKNELENKDNKVTYEKEYCVIINSEDKVLEATINQYPDYEQVIRDLYRSSEKKSNMKLTIKRGYLVSMVQQMITVVGSGSGEEVTFEIKEILASYTFSKINETKVSRPSGIEVPPQQQENA